jgi:hypothetical protein
MHCRDSSLAGPEEFFPDLGTVILSFVHLGTPSNDSFFWLPIQKNPRLEGFARFFLAFALGFLLAQVARAPEGALWRAQGLALWDFRNFQLPI